MPEGNKFQIEAGWTVADADRINAYAGELISLRPDTIMGVTTPVTALLVREFHDSCRIRGGR
jgi:hypothetical protein